MIRVWCCEVANTLHFIHELEICDAPSCNHRSRAVAFDKIPACQRHSVLQVMLTASDA